MTYFGYNTVASNEGGGDGGNFMVTSLTTWGSYTFVCPGSGNQTVKELSVYVKSLGGTAGTIRMAIYSADGTTKIAEGSASLTVNWTTIGWHGYGPSMDATLSPAAPTLVGGTSYRLAVWVSNNDVAIQYDAGSTADMTYLGSQSYGSGMPSSIPTTYSYNYRYSIRCGVDPESLVIYPDSWQPKTDQPYPGKPEIVGY